MFNFKDKSFYIAGVANKKSVAYFVAKSLAECGAKLIFSAQHETNQNQIKKLFPNSDSFILDVENKTQVLDLAKTIANFTDKLDGFLHSIAFAKLSPDNQYFHQTKREDYLQASLISSFSLTEMTNALIPLLSTQASIVTIGISNTRATNYGYLGPIKAMLESSVSYLAKSLSEFSQIRVNCVAAGPLKTSASAGIPGYLENYLFAEAMTIRKKALSTQEVANTCLFLLSELSSGINAQSIVVDAGMSANNFDQDLVKGFTKV
jgi:enoyl-[acyl-carrier protein] reductase I